MTPDPPAPTSTRWKPLRCGLVNVFKYDDQPFHFEDGHLLLRGDNGTGKSRVLAMTLPFLLDGEAKAYRIEPDGDAAKSVAWNLLMGEHEDRRGYSWIEFGRVDAKGRPAFCTLAIGMDAVRSRPGVKTWFGVTDKRVGDHDGGLALTRKDYPVPRGDFKEAVGEGFSDDAASYRQLVNRSLFGLDGHRYAALIDLLIELRRPQLSRDWNEQRMGQVLNQSLRPMPEHVLATAARAFEGLETQKRQLAELADAERHARRFLGVYRRYARTLARSFAEPVRKSHSDYEAAAKAARRAVREADAADAALAGAEAERGRLRSRLGTLEASVEELGRDPAMRTGERLREKKKEADAAAARASAARARADRARADLAAAAAEADTRAARLAARVDRAEEGARGLVAAAEAAALAEGHAPAVAALSPTPDRTRTPAVLDRLAALAASRLDAIARLGKMQRAVDEARVTAERRRGVAADQRLRVDAAVEALRAAGAAVEAAVKLYLGAVEAWGRGLAELSIDAAELQAAGRLWGRRVSGAVSEGEGLPPTPVPRAVQGAAETKRRALAADEAEAAGRRKLAEDEAAAVRGRIAELEAGVHEPPPAPHTRDEAARAGRAGAPLWRLVDFRPDLPEAERPGLEAALEAAGLLDAWVEPDGKFHADADDAGLVPTEEPALGRSLAEALAPVSDAAVPAETLARVLAAIAWPAGGHVDEHTAAVASTGNFRLGPLRGRWSKPAVQHVGETAREAERARRIEALRAELAELERRAAAAAAEAEGFRAARPRWPERWPRCPASRGWTGRPAAATAPAPRSAASG